LSEADFTTLRPARQEDQSTIRSLVRAAGLNPFGLDWPHFTLAVDAAGEVVGCVQLKPHKDGSTELASLLVVEGWRGRGLGRVLIEAAMDAHDGTLYLMCRPQMEALYRKFGFTPVHEEEMPPYFRRISRLAKVLGGLNKSAEGPLIMRRDAV